MNMVVAAVRDVGPPIASAAVFGAPTLAPHALPFHLLVEIELHVFNLVTIFEVSAAWVEVQVIFLAVEHEAIDGFSASVAPYYGLVAAFWWVSEELKGGARKEFMGIRCIVCKHTGFVEIKIAFIASVSRAEACFLAAIAGIRFLILLQLQFMHLVAWITQGLHRHFSVLPSKEKTRTILGAGKRAEQRRDLRICRMECVAIYKKEIEGIEFQVFFFVSMH